MPSRRQQGRQNPKWKLAGLGAELAGSIIGFTLLGIWIDHHFETSPWGLVVCITLGSIGGFYNLIRSSLRALQEPKPTARDLEHDE